MKTKHSQCKSCHTCEKIFESEDLLAIHKEKDHMEVEDDIETIYIFSE